MVLIKDGLLYDNDNESDTPVLIDGVDVLKRLNDPITGEGRVTLRDVFNIIDKNLLLSLVLPRYDAFIKPAFMPAVSASEAKASNEEADDEDPITSLVVYHYTDYHESDVSYSLNLEEDSDECLETIDQPFKSLDSYYGLSGLGESGTSYSISLTPIHKLLDIEVNMEFEGSVNITKQVEGKYDTQQFKDQVYISMYDFFTAIIEDLTFYGGSSGKEQVIEDLEVAMKEMDELINKLPKPSNEE